MKAIVFERYGSPDVLKLADVEKPVPKDHDVLIKVHAAAVNPADYVCMVGSTRIITGLFKPKLNRLGLDVAGQVEAVGPKVTQFKPGDEVYGACIRNPHAVSQTAWLLDFGSFAEFAISHEGALALKPANLSFEEAASVPCVAWTALQGLRTFGKIQPGHKVLISSATGGIGTIAVQIAKSFGAQVTGVCSTKNMDLVKSLGADHLIDYTKEDYTKQSRRYDMIFDSVGEHSLSTLRRTLTPDGKVILISKRTGGLIFSWMCRVLAGTVLSRTGKNNVIVDYSRPNKEDLLFISELLSSEKIKPVIAKRYSGLNEVPQAEQYVKEGHAWGKVVVTI